MLVCTYATMDTWHNRIHLYTLCTCIYSISAREKHARSTGNTHKLTHTHKPKETRRPGDQVFFKRQQGEEVIPRIDRIVRAAYYAPRSSALECGGSSLKTDGRTTKRTRGAIATRMHSTWHGARVLCVWTPTRDDNNGSTCTHIHTHTQTMTDKTVGT